jgi:dihydrofolate reductase
MPFIYILVAMSPGRAIGRAGELPWRLSADLQRFKRLTMGHAIVMGRKTLESIGRALPGRSSIVITRQTDYQPPAGVLVAHDLPAALRLAAADDEIFIIGGGEIYHLALPLADRLYLTLVEAEIAGDTFFPDVDLSQWRLTQETHHAADERNEHPHWFRVYERPALQPAAG